MSKPHDVRLKDKTISGGTSYSWPEDDDSEIFGRISTCTRHRIAMGTANVTIQVRYTPAGTLETITPPTDWSTGETLILGGVHQFVITATTGTDVAADIFSYRE